MPKAIAKTISAELRLFVITRSIPEKTAAGSRGSRKPQIFWSLLRPISSIRKAVNKMTAILATSAGCREIPLKSSQRFAPFTSFPYGMIRTISPAAARKTTGDRYLQKRYGKNMIRVISTSPRPVKTSCRLRKYAESPSCSTTPM